MKTKLKEIREARNITQSGLAQKLQVKQNTISMWETGQREPDIGTIIKIATFLNVTTDFLLGKDTATAAPAPPPPPPLNEEENNLLNSFRRLPTDGKQALLTVVRQMVPVRRSFAQPGLFPA